jgi:DNA-binding SARP family transcriptional activator
MSNLRFLMLGPLRGRHGGVELDLGTPQQQALLAVLLLRNGAPAAMDELIAAIWPEDLPRTAAGMVRSYVSRLRRSIAQAGAEDPIRSTAGGYALRPSAVEVDLREFLTGLSAAREARRTGETGAAAKFLREALDLWHGTALAGVPGTVAELERTRLEQLRAAAIEELAGDELELDRPVETVDSLAALVARHPLRERPRELLMLALYRSGRQAEALEVYRDVRMMMRDELGMEPGAALQKMHARILATDPDLLVTRPAARPVAPAQLPADLPDFVGRADELHALTDALRATGPTVPTVGIDGVGGVGKTVLAIRAAHRVAERFPDGQIVVEGSTVRTTSDALAYLLHAVTGATLPDSVAERAAMWRSLTAGRRILLILDDVRDGSVIRHLMPGAGGAAMLVTSRQKLLEAAGARWLTLGPLGVEETGELLGSIVDAGRLRAEPEAARRIALGTSGLPQIVRAMGFQLLARPQWSLAKAYERIFGHMTTADVHASGCERLESPYTEAMGLLDPGAARAFRLLAVLPDPVTTAPLVAALLKVSEEYADDLLEAVADAHLIEADGDGRYRYLHPIRLFARRYASIVDGPDEIEAILARSRAG